MGIEFSGDGTPRGQPPIGPTEPQEDPAARLRQLLGGVARGTGSRDEVREAASALVNQLRRANLPPEDMLLRIKEILAEVGLRPTYASAPPEFGPREPSIYGDLIAWCIREYYKDS
ncbi:MAG TPA: hypothetical protein VF159_12170 [Gemmatimonadaceae bacterium]